MSQQSQGMKIYKIFISLSLYLAAKPMAVDKKATSLTNRSTESARKFPFKINWVITCFITLSFWKWWLERDSHYILQVGLELAT